MFQEHNQKKLSYRHMDSAQESLCEISTSGNNSPTLEVSSVNSCQEIHRLRKWEYFGEFKDKTHLRSPTIEQTTRVRFCSWKHTFLDNFSLRTGSFNDFWPIHQLCEYFRTHCISGLGVTLETCRLVGLFPDIGSFTTPDLGWIHVSVRELV